MRYLQPVIIILSVMGWTSCINSPADAEECFWVEQQRCEMRGRCYEDFDVDGCKYYYREQCRTRQIVPEYSEDALNACLATIGNFGSNQSECNLLVTAEENRKLELCTIDALAACRPIVCEEFYANDDEAGGTEDTGGDDSKDSSVSEGLNP